MTRTALASGRARGKIINRVMVFGSLIIDLGVTVKVALYSSSSDT